MTDQATADRGREVPDLAATASEARGPWRLATAIVIVVLGLPVLVPALTRHVVSASDWALMELHTRDVFSAHPPQLGAYSRYGWAHPGPLAYYLFAVPYRLLGADARAMQLSALLLNLVSIGVTAWLVRGRGLLAFGAVLLAICALVWGLSPHALVDSWNVSIAVLPFLLTIVACWCALCGDRHALAIALLTFSFVFQAHIGFGLVIGPLVAATCAIRIRRWVQRDDRASDRITPRRTLLWSGVGIVLFLPVLYDTVAHWPGNLGELIGWSWSNDEPSSGLSVGLRTVGRASSLSFLRRPEPVQAFGGLVDPAGLGVLPGLVLLLLAAAATFSWRRARCDDAVLCATLLGTWLAGLIAASNIAGPLYAWLIEWMQPLAWLSWAAVGMVVAREVRARLTSSAPASRAPASSRRVAAASVAAALVVGAIGTFGTVGYVRDSRTTYLNAELVETIERFTRAAEGVGIGEPIRIEFGGDTLTAGALHAGLVNQLDRAGVDVCVAPNLVLQYGRSRVCAGRPDEYLLVRADVRLEPDPPEARLLAVTDPLGDVARAEADRLTDELAAILTANGRADQVPLLSTRFASAVLLDDPPPAVTAATVQVTRLSDLRQVEGQRLTLLLVPTDP